MRLIGDISVNLGVIFVLQSVSRTYKDLLVSFGFEQDWNVYASEQVVVGNIIRSITVNVIFWSSSLSLIRFAIADKTSNRYLIGTACFRRPNNVSCGNSNNENSYYFVFNGSKIREMLLKMQFKDCDICWKFFLNIFVTIWLINFSIYIWK